MRTRKTPRRHPARQPRRRLFDELMSGVAAIRDHRQGRVTLRSHRVERVAERPGVT